MCGYDLEHEFIYEPICPICGAEYFAGAQYCKFDNTLLIEYKDFTVKCAHCGAEYPPETSICPADGSPVYPKISGHKKNLQFGQLSMEGYVYPKASLGSRFWAWFIDGLCEAALSIPAIVFMVSSIDSEGHDKPGGIFLFMLGLLLLIIPMTYGFIKDGLGDGQSWGKRSSDLMVVNMETNMPCSKGKSALRNLFMNLPYINFVEYIMVFVNKNGQRIGDMVSRTQVIETCYYYPPMHAIHPLDKDAKQ
ncbi:MAG TPA: RDD family protein [Ignavibacteriales bacterium]|nr:RDD family protein [Ignavibacteriales bacterium]